jgi:hypothetical protein
VATLEGEKSLYHALRLISCQPRPGTPARRRPGGPGRLGKLATGKLLLRLWQLAVSCYGSSPAAGINTQKDFRMFHRHQNLIFGPITDSAGLVTLAARPSGPASTRPQLRLEVGDASLSAPGLIKSVPPCLSCVRDGRMRTHPQYFKKEIPWALKTSGGKCVSFKSLY